jgi:glycosyltransferase involved in cell wall biosynthesis
MKVAFDHQIFVLQRYGGVSRYFVELASRLPMDSVSEVAVVAPVHVNYYLSQLRTQRFARGRYIPFSFRGQTRVVSALARMLAPAAWRGYEPDIVHETYFSNTPIGRGRRRVVTVYDMIYELFPSEFPDAAPFVAAKRSAIRRADHVICISESTRKDLLRLYDVDPGSTSVIHLGHSLLRDGSAVEEPRPARGKPSILYVGNRGGYKNFRRLLRAYASSTLLRNDFELVAFGGAPFSSEELAEIESLGVASSVVRRAGADEALAASYRAATAFVFPSVYEGFGIPLLEAMHHGCPVVSSNRGPMAEVAGDASLYFDPENVEAMTVAIEKVVTSPSTQAELRARGYSRVGAFSWDRCATATAEVYKAVL